MISRKLMQLKVTLTYPLNAIEMISACDVIFQAQTSQPEYVKSLESDKGGVQWIPAYTWGSHLMRHVWYVCWMYGIYTGKPERQCRKP